MTRTDPTTVPEAPAALDLPWGKFCDGLRELGQRVLATPGTERDHAEGLRFLTHLLRSNLERQLDSAPERPHFIQIGPVLKYLADNPDTLYDSTAVSPRHTYRITGNRGDALYLSFTLYSGGRDVRIVADLNDQRLQCGPDGEFEIWLTPQQQPGNWMELAPDTQMLIVRQYFLDRAQETPAVYKIEPTGPAHPPAVLTAGGLGERLGRVERGVGLVVDTTLEQLRHLRTSEPNTFGQVLATQTEESGSVVLRAYPTPDNDYQMCRFELAEDQALVIRFRPPACRYWGVHLTNVWWQSPQECGAPTAINAGNAVLEEDGSVRVVVAHRDPGAANWLDTGGRREGTVLVRRLLPEDPDAVVRPETELVRTVLVGR
ncbi:DUF1214 domain-containing protein [Streptomyces sp. NPDC057694]|uniref:DUF1214 domain-containing protein n=1 Tax=Streptomyces sp. NPDC057694 TaxID=3346216 RepID=UPI0036B5D8E1